MDIAREKKAAEDKSQMSLNINFQNELLCRFESSRPQPSWLVTLHQTLHYIQERLTKSNKKYKIFLHSVGKGSFRNVEPVNYAVVVGFLIDKSFKSVFFCFL